MGSVKKGQQLDIPAPLSASDKTSFAYKTIKDRLPVIIVKTIDFFHRQRKELHKFGLLPIREPNAQELFELEGEAKQVISELTKLRKDLETNKTCEKLQPIEGLDDKWKRFNDDIELWNKALELHKLPDNSMPRYFDSPWLLVECYLYRKIKEIMLKTKHLKLFDPFVEQKLAALHSSSSQMVLVATHLNQVEDVIYGTQKNSHPNERGEFNLFLQLALWANKCDLSISGMSVDMSQSQKLANNLRESLESLEEKILCDNSSQAWSNVEKLKQRIRAKLDLGEPDMDNPIYIDLVADNSGYEIFVDLCLLHLISLVICDGKVSAGLKFRIHLKRMPWFVSDALRHDIDFLMKHLSFTGNGQLQRLARRWKSFFDTKFWDIQDHHFWTLPNDYSEMELLSPDLYATLKKSEFIIFKGDLNYRKLTGDRRWHLLTPFKVALRGFQPTKLVALRTAKADVVVGIENFNLYARINNNELPSDWMISGEYGLIQYDDPI